MATETQVQPPKPEAIQQVFQIGTGYIASSALQVAAQLKIADRLAGGAQTAAALAAATGANEDALYRILRVLAMLGVFDETSARTFALTPAGETLRTDVPWSTHPMALWLTDALHFQIHADIMHSVTTGAPAVEKTLGMPVFEYFAKHPHESAVFNNAMTAFSGTVAPAVADAYDFSGIDTLVDVAGGHGEILMSVLRRYPKMRGVLFDLEHVLEGARPRIKTAGLDSRITTQSGDFFKAVPGGGDAYIMKHIIHDWPDPQAITILKNIHTALRGKPHGRVILLESIIQPGNQPDFGKFIDLEMLLLPGGKERTEDEFRKLFEAAGFTLSRVVPTASPLSVIEAKPASR